MWAGNLWSSAGGNKRVVGGRRTRYKVRAECGKRRKSGFLAALGMTSHPDTGNDSSGTESASNGQSKDDSSRGCHVRAGLAGSSGVGAEQRKAAIRREKLVGPRES